MTVEETSEVAAPATPTRTFAVKNFIDEVQFKVDVSYSLTDLSNAFQNQAGLKFDYSRLAAFASRQVDDIKLVLEATQSTVYRSLRDKAAEAGDKVTETQLEKAVSASARVVAIKRAMNEAKQIEAIAKGAVESFRDRKDMLVQEGAASREERKGELRMMGLTAADDQLTSLKDRFLERQG